MADLMHHTTLILFLLLRPTCQLLILQFGELVNVKMVLTRHFEEEKSM